MIYAKMNPEVKQKWITALRSGQYKQGVGRLRDDTNKFCCLGVLCNIHAQEHPEFAKLETNPAIYNGSFINIGDIVQDWAHLYTARGELIRMNDNGKSFKQIANWIEKNL